MTYSSDLRERLPKFKELMQSVDHAENEGRFEDILPDILEYIKGAEPIGVNGNGEIRLPKTYVPENGPPVLMMHPGEITEGLRLVTTEAEAHTATRILGQSGVKFIFDTSTLESISIPSFSPDHIATTVSTSMTVRPHNPEEDEFTATVPRMIRMGADHPQVDTVSVLGHEIRHWGFHLYESGTLQSSPQKRLSSDGISTISEREAYGVSYAMERRLGYHASLESPAEVAQQFVDLVPSNAHELQNYVERMKQRTGVDRKTSAALTAVALTELYSTPDVPVTEEEVLAYRVAELI